MQSGQRFGPFVVETRLGAGGMGVVYRVRHESTGALHALKVLSASADREEVRRFVREGEALAAVDDHPHVVRVHAAGEVDGRRYLLMQLCTGGDLKARLRSGGLPFDEAARVVRDVARGIAHVHARGIVHRDLKPENVLFDDSGRTRVTDFGLARVAGAESLTATGTLLGTPAYMAPEQADGGDADARADVWALGGLLIAAITGRPPYQGATPINVIAKLLGEDPRWPSADRPDTPPALEAIVRRAMARAPTDRHSSAAALADDLERYLQGDPHARRPRGRVLLALAAGVLTLIAGGASWLHADAAAPPLAPPIPPAPREVTATSAPPEVPASDVQTPAPTWRHEPSRVAWREQTQTDPKHLIWLDTTTLLVAHDGGVSLMDAESGRTLETWSRAYVRGMVLGRDDLHVARNEGPLAVVDTLDPRTLEPRDRPPIRFEFGTIVSFSGSTDGSVLVVGAGTGEVRVLTSASAQPSAFFTSARGPTHVAVRADGGAVACATATDLHLLQPGPDGWRATRLASLDVAPALTFVEDLELVVGTSTGLLLRLDATSEAEGLSFVSDPASGSLRAHGHPIRGLARLGGVLLSAASGKSGECQLRAWDVSTRALLWRKEETGRRQLLGVAVSPDATRLALSFAVATRDGAPANTGDVEVWAPPD